MNRDSAPLGVIAREWLRIGLIGFGGPPAHVSLLRELVVRKQGWMDARAFEDANAACSLLPGPSSTQLSIFCAYRVGGPAGAVIGGLGFVVPAVIMVLALSLALPLFLAAALGPRGAEPGLVPRSRRSRSAPAASWSGRATTTRWRGMAIGRAG